MRISQVYTMCCRIANITAVIFLLIKVSVIKNEDSVIKSVTAKLSEPVLLSCHSPSPWLFCVWEGPRGDRVCGLRDRVGKGEGSMCGGSSRLKLTGQYSKR